MAYRHRGQRLVSEGRFDRAIADFDEAIRLDPEDAAAYATAAPPGRQKQEFDKAIADYDEAIRLDPERRQAYNNRGTAGPNEGNTTRPSPTSTRPSGSIPRPPRRTEPGRRLARKRDSTGPSPTSTRRSGSIPRYAWAYCCRGIAWTTEGGVRQGHRRLRRGHPARSPVATAYDDRGTAWNEQAGVRQGHRRLDRGDPARSQATPGLHQSRPRLVWRRRTSTGPSPITTRPSGSIPKGRCALHRPGDCLVQQGGVRQGHRR